MKLSAEEQEELRKPFLEAIADGRPSLLNIGISGYQSSVMVKAVNVPCNIQNDGVVEFSPTRPADGQMTMVNCYDVSIGLVHGGAWDIAADSS